MKKIAFVVQRYGVEVNGGAELHCRQWCEKLKGDFDISVLTSCAKDYYSWKNEYDEGECEVNGVRVLRFKVDKERDKKAFDKLSGEVFSDKRNLDLGEKWMMEQGPYCSGMFSFIEEHSDEYDAFVFFTYLYSTTYFGMQSVGKGPKVYLVPTAHDEPPIYLKSFEKVFERPDGIIFNTEEERAFVHELFGNESVPNILAGVGVEFGEGFESDVRGFKEKYGLEDYIVYVGRVDEAKGCKELFEYFRAYKDEFGGDLKLVLMGKEEISLPDDEDIISMGFVSDEDKFNGILGARLMVIPSKFESLSMVLLEAFLCGKAVFVNGGCEVLKGHVLRSNAGLCFSDIHDFLEGMKWMDENEEALKLMGENGEAYVKDNYSWKEVLKRVKNFIE